MFDYQKLFYDLGIHEKENKNEWCHGYKNMYACNFLFLRI